MNPMSWQSDSLIRRAILSTIGLIAFAVTPVALADPELLVEIALARDLICELRPSGIARNPATRTNPSRPGLGRGTSLRDLMVVIENVSIEKGTARIITSAGIGGRPVRVYTGETGVHFVEDLQTSVKVTTLQSCTRWKDGDKGRHCIRYDAVNRWHFDTSVHRNPDQSFLRQESNSYSGWCEPWRME